MMHRVLRRVPSLALGVFGIFENKIPFMKKILLLAIIAAMLFSCKKDNIPLPNVWKGPQTHGYAKAKRNGQDWEGSAGWAYALTTPQS